LNYEAYLEIHPDTLEDLSYTLAMRREKLSFRSFSVVQPNSKITMSPILKGLKRPSVAMVFSGQGAQWAQMGNELLTTDYRFRRDIRLMDDVLHSLKHAPEWTMEGIFHLQYTFSSSKLF
jgi:acyl transferase domain-containing protein